MMKKIAVLGSTGSVGAQTLEVVRYDKDIQVITPATGGNVKLIEEQIRESKPGLACLQDEKKAEELRAAVADLNVKVASGTEGLMEAAMSPRADLAVTAVVRTIETHPAITAMETGKDIALVNKETLVTAGHIIIPPAREKGMKLLPMDSEHSAIFQCLQGAADNPLHRILLAVSGGPLRGSTRGQLRQVRLKDALRHSSWSMGYRITIDSSTTISKGLGVMEAHWLFKVGIDQARVAVQPASIVHSMVEFEDGAVTVQLGTPGMKLPIQYALYYSECHFLSGERPDFTKLGWTASEIPDMETFRDLKLVYEVGRRRGILPTVFNTASEVAAALFPEEKASCLTIVGMIEGAMEYHCVKPSPDVAQTLEAEQETHDYIKSKRS